VGPVVISEIMYNPLTYGDAEYVELHNITGAPVPLWRYDPCTGTDVGWRFTDDGGITFDFPIGTTIGANGYIVLVKDETIFLSEGYPAVPPGVPVFEWKSGKLDNGGEKIQLSQPGDAAPVTQERYYIRVDRVVYSDGSHPLGTDPWPMSPDGTGAVLERKVDGDYGNDVINWQAGGPSPGL
jgi:hypothetical protein